MAGGRPKKKVNNEMRSISDDLENVEHVGDEYYELFDQLSKIDDKKNPEEYFRIEALAEAAWEKSVKSAIPFNEAHWVSKRAEVFSKKFLRAFQGATDIDYRDVAQSVVGSILTSGKYDYMLPKAKKAQYIKEMVKMRFRDCLRSQKKYNERFEGYDDEKVIKKKAG